MGGGTGTPLLRQIVIKSRNSDGWQTSTSWVSKAWAVSTRYYHVKLNLEVPNEKLLVRLARNSCSLIMRHTMFQSKLMAFFGFYTMQMQFIKIYINDCFVCDCVSNTFGIFSCWTWARAKKLIKLHSQINKWMEDFFAQKKKNPATHASSRAKRCNTKIANFHFICRSVLCMWLCRWLWMARCTHRNDKYGVARCLMVSKNDTIIVN